MLEERFAEIYTKFKISLYAKVFKQFDDNRDGLSVVEVFCVEVIYALGNPTVNEFASFSANSQRLTPHTRSTIWCERDI